VVAGGKKPTRKKGTRQKKGGVGERRLCKGKKAAPRIESGGKKRGGVQLVPPRPLAKKKKKECGGRKRPLLGTKPGKNAVATVTQNGEEGRRGSGKEKDNGNGIGGGAWRLQEEDKGEVLEREGKGGHRD